MFDVPVLEMKESSVFTVSIQTFPQQLGHSTRLVIICHQFRRYCTPVSYLPVEKPEASHDQWHHISTSVMMLIVHGTWYSFYLGLEVCVLMFWLFLVRHLDLSSFVIGRMLQALPLSCEQALTWPNPLVAFVWWLSVCQIQQEDILCLTTDPDMRTHTNSVLNVALTCVIPEGFRNLWELLTVDLSVMMWTETSLQLYCNNHLSQWAIISIRRTDQNQMEAVDNIVYLYYLRTCS